MLFRSRGAMWYAWCFSSSDLFGKEQDKEEMNLPLKKVRRLPGNLEGINRRCRDDGNISSVYFCIARKTSTRALAAKNYGAPSYDTFSVQYQKNNFYLAGARQHMWREGEREEGGREGDTQYGAPGFRSIIYTFDTLFCVI